MKTRVVNVHKEPYDVCIMRPSLFGNPFVIGKDGDRDEVCDKHIAWLKEWIENSNEIIIRGLSNKVVIENLYKLVGKDIGCCCKPKRCHGDFLAYLTNKL